jgi:hypothetical protein
MVSETEDGGDGGQLGACMPSPEPKQEARPMIEVKIDGFSGRAAALMTWEYTATGVVIRLHGALADAINANINK